MDFALTEDQRAIGEMAEGLFRDYFTDDKLKAFDQGDEPFMTGLWQQCLETGLHGLAIPEDAGGSGLGMTELFCVLAAQGQGLGLVPLWEHQIAARALHRFAGNAQSDLLAQAASGESLLTLSVAELNTSLASGPVLEGGGGRFRVSGRARAVPCGASAQRVLLLARAGEALQPVLIDPKAKGVEVIVGRANHGLEVADIQLTAVELADSDVLPQEATRWLEEHAIACTAALQLGVSEEQIRRTAEYLKEREQFGRAIGTFQAVQMTMADCKIAVEALRSALYQLLYRLDENLPSPAEALAVSHLSAEAAHLVGHKAQHVHGGVGVDLTYPIHRFLYWSRHLSMVLGSAEASLERLGDWLANNDKLGWKYDLDEHQKAL